MSLTKTYAPLEIRKCEFRKVDARACLLILCAFLLTSQKGPVSDNVKDGQVCHGFSLKTPMQLEPSLRLTGPENRQPSAGTPESRPTLCSGCRALRLSECLVPQKSWFQGAALLVRPPNANEATGHSSRASVPARRGKVGPELRGNVVLLSGPPRQGLRETEPAKKMPEERATGFARPAGTRLQCQGARGNC